MIVVTGIDTGIGKTLVSTWLCIHTGWAYWKPIQTGVVRDSCNSDSCFVRSIAGVEIIPEQYIYEKACSPHEASIEEGEIIEYDSLQISYRRLIIEGVGGVCVPLNMEVLFIDLLVSWSIPIVVVSSSRLGAINHTLLTLESLTRRSLSVLGIIMNGEYNKHTHRAIEWYTDTPILRYIPYLSSVTYEELESITLPFELQKYRDIQEKDS